MSNEDKLNGSDKNTLKQGGIGGMDANAASGDFHTGALIGLSAKSGDGGVAEHKDLRGSVASGDFHAGPQFAMSAKSGADKPEKDMHITSTSAGQGAFNSGSQYGMSSK